MADTEVDPYEIRTTDGWVLPLARGRGSAPGARPVLLVPGYGMNASIFRYHASGPSFFDQLRRAGLDPWSVDLRGASTTRATRGAREVRLADQAFIDLPTAIDQIRSVTGAANVGAIGCSLGGTLLYGLAGATERPGIDRIVAMGSPLRWSRTRLVRAFLASSPLSCTIPLVGSRRLAAAALPLAARFASPLLKVYLNPRITAIEPTAMLTRTVEDPLRSINREMARWMSTGHLDLDGVSVSRALHRYRGRLLVVHSRGDGICDSASALSALDHVRTPAEVLEVSHPAGEPIGHADLFLCDAAPERVFAPVARFLATA